MVVYYYTGSEIQLLVEETSGCITDSLEMARFDANHLAFTLLVAGVRFMGRSAKIVSPEKTILMSTLNAERSLEPGSPMEEFTAFCDQHPDRTVVVYAKRFGGGQSWVAISNIAVELLDAPTADEEATCRSHVH